MPELPEVEQVRKTLAPHILGRTVTAVEVYLPRQIVYPSAEQFAKELAGKSFTGIERRGKYLILGLGKLSLVVHLRMTGALLVKSAKGEAPEYAKIKFSLTGGINLWFTDIRTFGTLYLVRDGDYSIRGLETLGPEPLSAGFSEPYLAKACLKSARPIKSLILDQTVIAGLGNIYADESLALSGILPYRAASTLSREETDRLYAAINAAIAQGIENRGTTFRDYKDGEGNKGANQDHLLVYGRRGLPCKRCARPLSSCKVGGRGTTYCGFCQK